MVHEPRTSTPAVCALLTGAASDTDTAAAAAAAAGVLGATLELVGAVPLLESSIRSSARVLEPWERIAHAEARMTRHALELADRLELRRARASVRYGSRLSVAATLAAEPGVCAVAVAPSPRVLGGWSPFDLLLARTLGERLLLINRPVSAAPGAPYPDALALLRRHPLYRDVPGAAVRTAARGFDVVRLAAGSILVSEGAPSPAFWLLLEGSAAVSVRGRRSRVLGRGGCAGGFSMLSGRPAAATVTALTPVRALVAGRDQFRLVVAHDLVRLRLQALYAERYSDDLRMLSLA